MKNLHLLVREALERRRVEAAGCFVHNAAAYDLMDYGCDAVAAIEVEVSTLSPTEKPRDLASVMVVYARLIRELHLGDRCAAFLRRLQPSFRLDALAGVSIAWQVIDPDRECGARTLPESLFRYAEEILSNGTAREQRVARMIIDHANNAA